MALQDTNVQSNQQHAVPQNIMDVEFKIIGDLTMRQFSYLLVLGLLGYFNARVMIGIFKWPITIVLVLGGVLMAFVPVQDRGMDVWVVNFIKSIYKPTQRIWKKMAVIPTPFLYDSLNVVKQELITLAPTSSRRKLEEYLNYNSKDLPKDPLDIPEAEYILKVREMSKGTKTVAASVAPVSASKIVSAAPTPVSAVITTSPPVKPPVKEKVEDTKKEEKPVEKVVEQEKKDIVIPPIKEEVREEPIPVAEEKKQEPSKIQEKVKEENVPEQEELTLNLRTETPQEATFDSLTPDRHSGRRFTSFLPSQGELILPIRGERVLKTSEQLEIEENIEEKTQKLQDLLSQIRKSNIKPMKKEKNEEDEKQLPIVEEVTEEKVEEKPKSKQEVIPEPVTEISENLTSLKNQSKEEQLKEAKVMLSQLTEKRENLLNELSKMRGSDNPKDKEKTQKLQDILQNVNKDYQKLQSQLHLLQKSMENIPSGVEATKKASEATVTDAPALNKPNILWGFTKYITGKPISDVVVIVKNSRGEPIRATKTNTLGQFILTTPLREGKYTVEVSSTNKTGLTFDIISVEASGNIIPPIQFVGK